MFKIKDKYRWVLNINSPRMGYLQLSLYKTGWFKPDYYGRYYSYNSVKTEYLGNSYHCHIGPLFIHYHSTYTDWILERLKRG